jgi:hypothetical protein
LFKEYQLLAIQASRISRERRKSEWWLANKRKPHFLPQFHLHPLSLHSLSVSSSSSSFCSCDLHNTSLILWLIISFPISIHNSSQQSLCMKFELWDIVEHVKGFVLSRLIDAQNKMLN